MTVFRKGDLVRATCDGRSVVARVVIASPNGRAIMIDWSSTDDGMLTGHVGKMPILRGDDGVYRSILDGAVVDLAGDDR